jgi:hypothetical protein
MASQSNLKKCDGRKDHGCCCRAMGRWLERAAKYEFDGPGNGLDRLSHVDGMYTWDNHGWEGSGLLYEEWLSHVLCEAGAVKLSQLLSECECCERHQENRAEVLSTLGSLTKSALKR